MNYDSSAAAVAAFPVLAERVDSVEHQIDDHLFEPVRVADESRARVVELQQDLHAAQRALR